MQPEFTGPSHDWWQRPSDGSLVPLVLQTGGNPQLLPETSRWSRLGSPISRVSPLVRVSYWIGSSLFIRGTRKYDLCIRSIAFTALKLVLALPVICVLVFWAGNLENSLPQLDDAPHFIVDLRYDTVHVPRSTDDGSSSHPYQPAPAHINDGSTEDHTGSSEQPYTDNIGLGRALPPSDRRRIVSSPTLLRPRYLCFVKDFDKGIYETVKVSEYLENHGDDIDLEFVFVSYTRMQFRVATEVEIDKHEYPDEATREANREIARRDRRTLAQWGIDAAKRVGKRAFWLDFECVRNDDGVARSTSSSEDVYRICDIVRAAHSMIIAIGPSASDKVAAHIDGRETPGYRREEVTPWLRQWGSRLWTLPELLLCPAEYRIKLYVLGDAAEPKAIAKRNFAERAWDDAEAVKELVDHFEGSAILAELRLIEAAFSCFSRRQTDQFSQGDIAYATMGLFPSRHRPPVNKEDSGFQAFVKLSLANNSGAFLSRLLCLAPGQGAPWHRVEDRWGVALSDIYPISKVSGPTDSEAIILDGVYGATIHWDKIDAEPWFGRNAKFITPWLAVVQINVFIVSVTFLVSVYTVVNISEWMRSHDSWQMEKVFFRLYSWILPGVGLIAGTLCIVVIASRCQPQPPHKCRLFGMEGIVAASKVAEYLWGFDHGELTTVTSLSYSDTRDSRQPLMPSQCFPRQEENAFTLVDTKMMTVTHLHCSHPPVAMLVCGSERGVQRSLLCSYNWSTQTFHRQAVLRVARQGLDQLHLIDGVRFSLAPHPDANTSLPEDASNSTLRSPRPQFDNDLEVGAGKHDWKLQSSQRLCRTWKTELLFLALCFVSLPPIQGIIAKL
ncbi:uncharacterized protein LY79DRAFT_277025 [Colletotrichum navitas]|uniref:3-hydroxyisobutyrate dehydrogenase protein n=1 Tax=Colletotrichum navitas TaxID=681940 RepID=A0AAD8V2V0_9PEZI|nr:uncharacterized protein LY79DRAFT_277025 [Colletotrichum navitas]KAK1585188.1 hypothetical protein LY79DRAFT_277025 [Colletotrichum navitas]